MKKAYIMRCLQGGEGAMTFVLARESLGSISERDCALSFNNVPPAVS